MKVYTNTMRLNCKQVAKFQQNRSTSATATASLVRSLKSISVHYRHRRDWLLRVRPCEWQDFSIPKVCVQNVHRVHEVERKLQDVDATAWVTALSMTTWWKCSHSSIRRDFSWSTSRGCGTHNPAAFPPNLVVDGVKVTTVGWPQSWSDEVRCFMS